MTHFTSGMETSTGNILYIKLSQMCHDFTLTVLWQFYAANVSIWCFLSKSEMCHKTVISDLADSFMTVLWTWVWQFYGIFMRIDIFMRVFWMSNDKFVTYIWNWQIYDRFMTLFWQIYNSFMEMIVIWEFYDRYMIHLWKSWDLH